MGSRSPAGLVNLLGFFIDRLTGGDLLDNPAIMI
jgi:hypothetical protein